MKILFNIHALHIGGAESIVTEYLCWLKKLGHEVTLVLDERVESFLQERVDREGIKTISLRPQYSYTICGRVKRFLAVRTINYQKIWAQILEEVNPDVVHLHSSAWILPFPRERTVFTFHSSVERNLSILGEKHKKNLIKLADEGVSFFCLSEQAQMDVHRIFYTDRTVRIPNGVDLEKISQSRYNRSEFLSQIEIPTSAFVLGHVGRFHPVKNHKKVIEVFEKVASRQDAYLVLVGTGDAAYVQEIKDQVKLTRLEDRVVFLGLRSDATQIMGVFDALILPSLSEAFPLTLIEAQALGVRSIASDVVPKEMVCNDNCFTLGLNASAEEWADYIMGDFLEKKSMELAQFDIKRVTEVLCSCYENLIG